MVMTGPERADRTKVVVMLAVNAGALFQSYRALFDFASHQAHWPLWTAWLFPLFIDSFLVCGELQLYTAHARREGSPAWAYGWSLFLAGLGASLAGNIAHAGMNAPPSVVLAAAVPPLAAAASLGVVLGLVKRRAKAVPARSAAEAPGRAPRQPAPARRTRASTRFWASTPQAKAIAERIQAGEGLTDRKVAAILSEQLDQKVSRYSASVLIKAAQSASSNGDHRPSSS
jgi:Protein of unknown function (DUF2637)